MEVIKKQYEEYKRQARMDKAQPVPKEPIYGHFTDLGEIGCGWSIIHFDPNQPVNTPGILEEELVISTQGQPLWRRQEKGKYMVKHWLGATGIKSNDNIDQQIARMKTCIQDMPSELLTWQNTEIIAPKVRNERHITVMDNTQLPNIEKLTITSIHGTPGSGKTTLITNLLKKLKSEYKILIVAPSHNVVNNFGHKLHKMRPKPEFTILSEESRLDNELMKYHVSNHDDFNPSKKNAIIEATQITISTVTKNIKNVRRAKIDIVICDEAGRVPIIDFVTLTQKMSGLKSIILAGDPMQMPARIGDKVTEDILRYVERLKTGTIWHLFRQYRFGTQSNSIISNAFYEGKMQSAKEKLDSRIFGVNIVECDCDEKTPIGCSEEAKIVLELSRILRENKGEDLLVITPYKAQLDILSEMTRDNKLRIKTIDTVQGDEAESVIISMGRHKGQGFINRQRMNVALSRARGWTLIVGNKEVIEGCQALTDVLKAIKNLNQNYDI